MLTLNEAQARAALVRELMAPKPRKSKAAFPPALDRRRVRRRHHDPAQLLFGGGRLHRPHRGCATHARRGAGGRRLQPLRGVRRPDPGSRRRHHVEGEEIERARDKAFAQRNDGPAAWGKCLTDPASSWTQRRLVEDGIARQMSSGARRAIAAARVAELEAEYAAADSAKIARGRFKVVGGTAVESVAAAA